MFCGEAVLAAAERCRHCGERLVASEGYLGDPDDVLSSAWHTGVWALLLVPIVGSWIVVILTSILYYVWRKDYPNRARTINRSGWMAWFLGNVVWCLAFSVIGSRY